QLVTVDVDANFAPIPCEVELHRGIWITGRVTNKATGAPVSVRVDWFPYRSNEFARKRTPEFEANGRRLCESYFPTQPDGTFRVVGLPGRAIVGAYAMSPNHVSYLHGSGSQKLEGASGPGMVPGRLPPTVFFGPGIPYFHSLKEIDVPEGAESFAC